jgi:predicted small metal-binding protein
LLNKGVSRQCREEKRRETSMAEQLKKIECDPKCGFLVRSHDEKEIIAIAAEHAKKFHHETVSEKEIKAMIKDA